VSSSWRFAASASAIRPVIGLTMTEGLEHLTHRMEQRLRLITPLVGRVDHGTAEDDVVGEEADEAIQVAGLDCATEFLHLASTVVR
jgi:hypothetical protein